ncbi:hypothetical protein TSOC_008444, partial [Tetrabaena socialis]
IQCTLSEYDVVYAPSITGYGSCPATLEPSPGTTVSVFITYLTDEMKRDMDVSEGVASQGAGYHLEQLVGLIDDRYSEKGCVYGYVHKLGSFCLPIEGEP